MMGRWKYLLPAMKRKKQQQIWWYKVKQWNQQEITRAWMNGINENQCAQHFGGAHNLHHILQLGKA